MSTIAIIGEQEGTGLKSVLSEDPLI